MVSTQDQKDDTHASIVKGSADYYIFTNPLRLTADNFSELLSLWHRAVPYWGGGRRLSNRELAQLVIHFTDGRLFLGRNEEDWLFIDKTEIISSRFAYDRAFGLVAEWLKACLRIVTIETTKLSAESQENLADSPTIPPDPTKPEENSRYQWLKHAISDLDSGRSAESINKMVRKELSFGVGKKDFSQTSPEEKAVIVREDGSRRIFINIYNFLTGKLRPATYKDDISTLKGLEFPKNITLASPERVEKSKTYAMFANMFRKYQDVDKEIRLFWKFFSECYVPGNISEIIILWKGKSGTGKSVLENVTMRLLGDDKAISLDPEMYQYNSRKPDYQRASLEGKYVAFLPEIAKGMQIDGDKLKRDTSKTLSARDAGKSAVNFPCTHVPVLTGNEDIKIANLAGLQRRIFYLETEGISVYKHLNDEGEQIAEHDMFNIMLNEELDVFLSLISEGRKARHKEGLIVPLEHSFSAAQNILSVCAPGFSDLLIYLLENEEAKLSKKAEFTSQELYARYEQWFLYVNNGLRSRLLDRARFSKQYIAPVFGSPIRSSNGKSYYKGMELSEISSLEFELAEEETPVRKRIMLVRRKERI